MSVGELAQGTLSLENLHKAFHQQHLGQLMAAQSRLGTCEFLAIGKEEL